MIDECVTSCGNTKCRYNAVNIKAPASDVRMVYMRDRPRMGCEGYKRVSKAQKEKQKKTAGSRRKKA